MTRSTHSRRGFTLIEAIATMVVLAVVSAASSSVMWVAVRAFDEGAETSRLQAEASVAMERIIRDLRAIPVNASGTPDISSVTSDSIAWSAGTRTLRLAGSELLLAIDGVERVLVADVTAFELRAFDASNLAMSTSLSGSECAAARRLSLQLTVASGRASSSVRTKVFFRCMLLEELR